MPTLCFQGDFGEWDCIYVHAKGINTHKRKKEAAVNGCIGNQHLFSHFGVDILSCIPMQEHTIDGPHHGYGRVLWTGTAGVQPHGPI